MTTVVYSSYTYQSTDPKSNSVHDAVSKRQAEPITGSLAGVVLLRDVLCDI